MKKSILILSLIALSMGLTAEGYAATGTIIIKNPQRPTAIIITIGSDNDDTQAGEELELINCPQDLKEGDNIIFKVIETGPPSDRKKIAIYEKMAN